MKQLLNLLQIKKIVTLLMTIAFVYLSLKGTVSSTEFLSIFTIIIGFYFGQSTVKETKIKAEENKAE